MSDKLCLGVDVEGENIMGNPLLKAHGFTRINGKYREIKIETPITSVKEFIEVFEGLFKEDDQ
ncbi:MAG: hypothetical protein H8E40_14755 [Chloroflexi bacterium]|nr:hypothetical protein [Chloroflexota bacterium]